MDIDVVVYVSSLMILIFTFLFFDLRMLRRAKNRIYQMVGYEYIENFVFHHKKNYTIEIEEKLKQKNIFERYFENLTNSLHNAGFRDKHIFKNFMIFKVLVGILSAIIIQQSFFKDLNIIFFIVINTIIVELLSPKYLSMKQTKRLEQIYYGIPNLLDFFIICTDAGYSVQKMISLAAQELKFANPELAEEMDITNIEMDVITDQKIAIENLYKRVPIDDMKNITVTLIQSINLGSPLGEHLHILSSDISTKRLLTLEEKAGKLPTMLLIPMMFFILPALFVSILGPVFFRVLEHVDK